MDRVLITGATGYIGGCLCKELIRLGKTVFVIVRHQSVIDDLKQYLSDENIIFSDEFMTQKIIECKPDICIHLAGRFMTTHSISSMPMLLESNITFPSLVCEAAYEAGCRKFINTGSYWQNYNEDEYNPVNYYAATKEAMKKIFQYYAYSRNCYVITLKIFDTYGKGDNRRKILNIISKMEDGESIDMTAGIQKMYFCYIDDIISAFIVAMQRCAESVQGLYEEFFLRGDEAVTLKEVVQTYLNLSHKSIQINWGKREYLDRDILDPTDYGTPLPNWSPLVGLEEGLRKAFDL